MGLTCTDIPSPTSIPVGCDNGGILHSEHSTSCFDKAASPATRGRDLHKEPNGTFQGNSIPRLQLWQNSAQGVDTSFISLGLIHNLRSYLTDTGKHPVSNWSGELRGNAGAMGSRPWLKARWPCWDQQLPTRGGSTRSTMRQE